MPEPGNCLIHRLIRELTEHEDAIAATSAGAATERVIEKLLADEGVEYRSFTIRAVGWSPEGGEARLPLPGGTFQADPLPPFTKIKLEGLAVPYRGPRRDYSGLIVVAEARTCTSVEEVYSGATAAGEPLLVVFASPARLRCPLSPRPLPPRAEHPPVPAVVVHGPTYRRVLAELPVLLRVDTVARSSYGYARSFIAPPHLGDETALFVTAHFDHWLRGAHDNASGVAAALTAYLALKDRGQRGVGLVLLNGEEYGEDTCRSLYWGAAARRLAEALRSSRAPSVLFINVDTVSLKPLALHGSMLAGRLAAGDYMHVLDDVEFDSVWLRGAGPALTIASAGESVEGIIHTDLDTPGSIDYAVLGEASRLVTRAVEAALSLRQAREALLGAILDIYLRLARLPLPFTLREAFRLLRLAKKGAIQPLTALSVLERALLAPIQAAGGSSAELSVLLDGSWRGANAGKQLVFASYSLGSGLAAVRLLDRIVSSRLRVAVEAAIDDLLGDSTSLPPLDEPPCILY